MVEAVPVVPRQVATADLRQAAACCAAEADGAVARRFIDAAEQDFTRIGSQPGLGSPCEAVELGWPGLRRQKLERFPSLVFSVELSDHLDVLRVLHTHRDTPTDLDEPVRGG